MSVFIEKLSSTDGVQQEVLYDANNTNFEKASMLAKSQGLAGFEVNKGDVIHVDEALFLVESDKSVTEIEQEEYAYYKNIDLSERLTQWFSEDNS